MSAAETAVSHVLLEAQLVLQYAELVSLEALMVLLETELVPVETGPVLALL